MKGLQAWGDVFDDKVANLCHTAGECHVAWKGPM